MITAFETPQASAEGGYSSRGASSQQPRFSGTAASPASLSGLTNVLGGRVGADAVRLCVTRGGHGVLSVRADGSVCIAQA